MADPANPGAILSPTLKTWTAVLVTIAAMLIAKSCVESMKHDHPRTEVRHGR